MRYYVNSTIDQEKHSNNKKIIKQMTEQINSTFEKYAEKSRTHGHVGETVSPRTYANKNKIRRQHHEKTNRVISPKPLMYNTGKQENDYEKNNVDIDSILDPADNDNQNEQNEEDEEEEHNKGLMEEQFDNELSEV